MIGPLNVKFQSTNYLDTTYLDQEMRISRYVVVALLLFSLSLGFFVSFSLSLSPFLWLSILFFLSHPFCLLFFPAVGKEESGGGKEIERQSLLARNHNLSSFTCSFAHSHRGGRGNVFVLVRDDPVAATK